eukprot:3352569-Prymnesium_polylepis.1
MVEVSAHRAQACPPPTESVEPLRECAHTDRRVPSQDKTYPRDLAQRGRIRVVLKNVATGEPVNDEIKT